MSLVQPARRSIGLAGCYRHHSFFLSARFEWFPAVLYLGIAASMTNSRPPAHRVEAAGVREVRRHCLQARSCEVEATGDGTCGRDHGGQRIAAMREIFLIQLRKKESHSAKGAYAMKTMQTLIKRTRF